MFIIHSVVLIAIVRTIELGFPFCFAIRLTNLM